MNDLNILHEAWDAPMPPSPAARARARGALLERARPRPRRRHRRIAAAVALAASIALAATVAQNLDDAGRTLPSIEVASAAMVLERAATAAEHKTFTAPRPDQWFYFEDRFTAPEGTFTTEGWRRADGGATAANSERTGGRLEITKFEAPKGRRPRPAVGPLASYESLAKLPTDPEALKRWAYDLAKNVTGAGLNDDGDVYAIFNGMLRDSLMPPELEAAIFRALKEVPGVRVQEIEVSGRPALALAQTEDWLEEELLLDRQTYAYLGERSTVVKDATISPEKAGNATGRIAEGHKVVVERLASGIVDEAGQRP
jgi:hypothetical protein